MSNMIMRKLWLTANLAAVVSVGGLLAQRPDCKNDFAGDWVRISMTADGMRLVPAKGAPAMPEHIVKIKQDSVGITVSPAVGPAQVQVQYRFDGTPVENRDGAGAVGTYKSAWIGCELVTEIVRKLSSGELKSKERRALQPDGTMLLVVETKGKEMRQVLRRKQ